VADAGAAQELAGPNFTGSQPRSLVDRTVEECAACETMLLLSVQLTEAQP
jgi:hypothetical protein